MDLKPEPMILIVHSAGSLCKKGIAGSYRFNMIISEGPTDKMTLNKALKKGERENHVTIQEELPGSNNSQCKGPEEGEFHVFGI